MALWNFTVPDTSPILSYHPYADGFGLQNGWQTSYSVSGFNTQPGESPMGDSSHLTSMSGATLTLPFYGSAVYLYGTSSSSYDVTLDDTVHPMPPTSGLLYFEDGLIEGNHSVTLTAKPTSANDQLGFSQAIVSISDQLKDVAPVFFDNSNPALSYTGSWTDNTVAGIPNSTVTAPFHQTLVGGSSVFFNFSGAAAIALYGTTNFGHELYSVSVDSAPPAIHNGSTYWLVANTALFFQAALDPNVTHTLNATNLSPTGKFTLSSVITYQVAGTQIPAGSSPSGTSGNSGSGSSPSSTRGDSSSGSSPSSTNGNSGSDPTNGVGTSESSSQHAGRKIGVIVGPIAGAVVLLSLILVFILRARLRRNRINKSRTAISPLILPPPEMAQAATPSIAEAGVRKTRGENTTVSAPRDVSATAPLSSTPGIAGAGLRKGRRENATVSAPTTASATAPPASSVASPISPEVTQIIELIAQRIDRRENRGREGVSPPRYSVH